MYEETGWRPDLPGDPGGQPECIHKYVTRADGTVTCEKCGSVLRTGGFEAYNSYARPSPVQPARASSPWRWVIIAGVIALAVVAVLGWKYSTRHGTPVAVGDKPETIDLSYEPVQTDPGKNFLVLSRGDGLTIVTRAKYKIWGKVVGVRHFAGFDKAATGFPIDLGLAWGDVGKSDFDKYVNFYFSNDEKYNQWLMYKYDRALPWDEGYLTSHVSNNHICPATLNLFNAITALKKGDLVVLEGYLAESRSSNGQSMDTSLSRGDTGAGACEAFFVQKMQVGNTVYK